MVRLVASSAFEATIYCRFYIKLHFQRRAPRDLPSGPLRSYDLKTNKYFLLTAIGEDIRNIGPTGTFYNIRCTTRSV